VIIAAFGWVEEYSVREYCPKIVMVNAQNQPVT
jgi:aspartate 1-decarboxylase